VLNGESVWKNLSAEERLQNIMRRVFATKLFCLLKAAETGDTSWIIKDLGIEALLTPFFFSQFNIARFLFNK
jgi:hypothetical protein